MGETLYPHCYVEADFKRLAVALRDCPHPWVMTVGDDEVSDKMPIPGSSVFRIRQPTEPMARGGIYDAQERAWIVSEDEGDDPSVKTELLWVSGTPASWGLPTGDPGLLEELFGEAAEHLIRSDQEVEPVVTEADEPVPGEKPNEPRINQFVTYMGGKWLSAPHIFTAGVRVIHAAACA